MASNARAGTLLSPASGERLDAEVPRAGGFKSEPKRTKFDEIGWTEVEGFLTIISLFSLLVCVFVLVLFPSPIQNNRSNRLSTHV